MRLLSPTTPRSGIPLPDPTVVGFGILGFVRVCPKFVHALLTSLMLHSSDQRAHPIASRLSREIWGRGHGPPTPCLGHASLDRARSWKPAKSRGDILRRGWPHRRFFRGGREVHIICSVLGANVRDGTTNNCLHDRSTTRSLHSTTRPPDRSTISSITTGSTTP